MATHGNRVPVGCILTATQPIYDAVTVPVHKFLVV